MKSELTYAAIRTHYVQAKLRLDVLATLPYEALAPIGLATASDTKTILLAVALLRLPRLLRCSRLLEHFRVAFGWLPPQLRLSKAQARLVSVWSFWIYVAHVFSCWFLFHAYTLPLSALGRNWMTEDLAWKRADWAHVTIWTSYLRAAHLVLFHMASIGTGDVRPQNAWETGSIMVLVLVSASMTAYLVGLISSYARLGDVQEELLKTQTDYLQHYMRHHPLPHMLAKRIASYYRVLSSNPRISHAHLLQELPPFLLRDLGLWMHRDHLLNVPALGNLTFFPLVEICLALQPELFLESDTVITKGAPAVMFYLVDVGKLRVHRGREPLKHGRFSEADPSKSPPATPTTRRRSVLLNKDANDVLTVAVVDGAHDGAADQSALDPSGEIKGDIISSSDAAMTKLQFVSRGFIVGRHGAVGVEMLAFNGPQAPVLSERYVEAVTHCHLFGLSLGAWKGLCAKFADELGPISRGEAFGEE